MMIERLLFVLILFGGGVLLYRWWVSRQLATATIHSAQDPLLVDAPAAVPIIIYFTTPTCVPCQLQQTPTLASLKQEYGDALHIVRVDATEDPAAASRWGVFSVPTIFILDAAKQPQQVFNGVVSAERLKQALSLRATSTS